MLAFRFSGGRLAACLAALLATVPHAPAMAELLVAPTRVTLDEKSRTAELVLVNRGDGPAAFRLSLENRRMREDGSLEAAPEGLADERFALDMLRFSPRQLVLEPGERQVVRIMAKSPAGLAPGEYRSHLRLMSAPAAAARPAEDEAGDTSLSIELIAIRSITVPVIFRVGKLDAIASIDAAALSEAEPDQLVIRLTRSGTRSTYGDITITPEGAARPVWTVRGVAIYTPNTSREAVLPLPPEVRAQLADRKVRIAYISSDEAVPETRGKVLAELSLAL